MKVLLFSLLLSPFFLFSQNTDKTNTESPVREADGVQSVFKQKEGERLRLLKEHGYFLTNRYIVSEKIEENNCEEIGQVAVRIEVNREGEVVKAIPGARLTTTNSECLRELAYKKAKSILFNQDQNAEELQIGSILFKFHTK